MHRNTHQNNRAHATKLPQGLFQIDSSVFLNLGIEKLQKTAFYTQIGLRVKTTPTKPFSKSAGFIAAVHVWQFGIVCLIVVYMFAHLHAANML